MVRMPRAAKHRVAMVLPRLDLGGMERTLLSQATALRARGIDVHLITLQEGGALRADAAARRIPVHEGRALANAGRSVAFLDATARRLGVTHLHSHTGSWWPAARAARRLRIPHLHTRHGFVESLGWRGHLSEWLAARSTDTVLCVSDALRIDTMRRLRVGADRCLLLRNGIDLDTIPEAVVDPGIHLVAQPALALVCRLAPIKNVPLAVHVLARLRVAWPTMALHLIGDGPEQAAISAAAEAVGVREGVHFHGASAEPWAHVPPHAVVLQTSDSEGLSLSLIEALAHGHRVVATDVGETRAFCGDASGVLIVPPGDVDAMTDALKTMLAWSPDAVRCAEAANRAHARAHGSLEVVIDRLIGLYDMRSGDG